MSGPACRTLALVLPGQREVVALHPVALTQGQAPRATLAGAYAGALLLYPDGIVRRIDAVRVLGPWGATPLRRLVSRLTNGWRIETVLSEPLDVDAAALRALLPAGGPAVEAAGSTAALYAALDLPPLEDALDVL
jgi:hypothetical protein